MAKRLLIESYPTTFEILEEASEKTGGLLKIRAETMSVADEINGNGRVYPLKTWAREIGKLQESVEHSRNVGAADHPGDGVSRISEAAIRWSKIWMDGPITRGEGYVLKTHKGQDLEALIRGGVTVDVSSRAWGSLVKSQWKGKIAEVAQDDLELVTFDAVLGGSVSGAHLKAVNEQKNKEGGMDWKEIIEGLRKEHAEAFSAFEKHLKETVAADVEKKVMAEMKKLKVDEAELRKKIEGELAEQYKEPLERLAAIEKWLELGKGLIVVEAAGDDDKDDASKELQKIQDQLSQVTKALETEKAKTKEVEGQLTERERQDAVKKKITELTQGKEHGELIAERLAECKTVEEVESRAASEEGFIKKLLIEKKPQPSGDGRVKDDDDKDDGGKWTPEQKKQRTAIGLPV